MKGLVVVIAVIYYLNATYRRVIHSVTDTKATACLEYLGSTTSDRDGHNYIVGSVRNNCTGRFLYVQIAFNLDRRTSDTLPSANAMAYGRDLEPGKV